MGNLPFESKRGVAQIDLRFTRDQWDARNALNFYIQIM